MHAGVTFKIIVLGPQGTPHLTQVSAKAASSCATSRESSKAPTMSPSELSSPPRSSP